MQMTWANFMEQNPVCKSPRSGRESIERASRFLSEAALRDLRAYTAHIELLLAGYPDELDHWPDKSFLTHGPVERLGGLVDFYFDELVCPPTPFHEGVHAHGRALAH